MSTITVIKRGSSLSTVVAQNITHILLSVRTFPRESNGKMSKSMVFILYIRSCHQGFDTLGCWCQHDVFCTYDHVTSRISQFCFSIISIVFLLAFNHNLLLYNDNFVTKLKRRGRDQIKKTFISVTSLHSSTSWKTTKWKTLYSRSEQEHISSCANFCFYACIIVSSYLSLLNYPYLWHYRAIWQYTQLHNYNELYVPPTRLVSILDYSCLWHTLACALW